MRRSGRVVLYLGGARSGKSRAARCRAESSADELFYLATARPGDAEMAGRIERHRAERGERWRTIEVPLDLPQVLLQNDALGRTLLVDCLTLWLSNLMLAAHDVRSARRALVDALADVSATVLLVSNEVGMGIVPDNALARGFRDEAGWLHQQLAAVADEVWLVMAGLPLSLKGS